MFAKVAHFLLSNLSMYLDICFQKRHFLFKVKTYAKKIPKKTLDGGGGMDEVQTRGGTEPGSARSGSAR